MDEKEQAEFAATIASALAEGHASRQAEVDSLVETIFCLQGEICAWQIMANALLEVSTQDARARAAVAVETARLNPVPSLAAPSQQYLTATLETLLASLRSPPRPPETPAARH